MQINEINIEGFGIFYKKIINQFKPGINIITGNNEAGKSTLLQFIRFTLFGYPRSVDERMQPVCGGNHGGRIKTTLSNGKEAIFERTAGFPGNIQLHYAGKTSHDINEWFYLLGNATLDLYKYIYGISLNELVGLDTLTQSGMEDRIFSVGLGLKNTSLGDIEKSISGYTENIYKKQGKIQLIPKYLNNINEKRKKIHALQELLPKYDDLTHQINQKNEELKEINVKLKDWRNTLKKLEQYQKCYESYVRINQIDHELEALPGTREYPEKGKEKMERLEEEKEKLKSALKETSRHIRELKEKTDNITYNENILSKDEEINEIRRNTTKYQSDVKEQKEDSETTGELNKKISQGIRLINQNWDESNIRELSNVIIHKDVIHKYKVRFEELQNKQHRIEDQLQYAMPRAKHIHWPALIMLLTGICLVTSIAFFIHESYPWGGALLLISIGLFFGRKHIFTGARPGHLMQEELDTITNEHKKVTNEYQAYIQNQLNLDPDLSPDAVLETFRETDRLLQLINERERLQNKMKQRNQFISKFEEQLQTVSATLSGRPTFNDSESLIITIINEFENALDAFNKLVENEKTLVQKKKDTLQSEKILKDIDNQIQQLLTSTGAKDINDFYKKYRDNERGKHLSAERSQLLQTIQTIVGVDNEHEPLSYFASRTKPELDDAREEAAHLSGELEQASVEYNKEISALHTERNGLMNESELSGVMTEYETERGKLNQAAKNWIAGNIALQILEDVKQQYEQEKQPAVIRNSGNYFNRITGGHYNKILISLENKEVSIFDTSNAVKRIRELSRGTKEQLLISLRLGFIEEYEKETEPLPLALDEILVNFDRERALKTAKVLYRFAQKRQVLLFTCHPFTASLFDGMEVNKINIH